MKFFPALIICILSFGIFFRAYNLNWGAPFYFHPDERNIASAVSQLSFPKQLNPHFFSYGSFPIYSIYFTGFFIQIITSCRQLFSQCTVPFELAIIISRIYSLLFSVLLIPLSYLIIKRYFHSQELRLVLVLTTMNVGLIQYAHFGTFEMWLTFFSSLLFFVCLSTIKHFFLYKSILLGLIFGLLVGIKVSSIALLPLPFFALMLPLIIKIKKTALNKRLLLMKILISFFLFSVVAIAIFAITNPFVFLDTSSFINSIHYESNVAFGSLAVFYTGEFYITSPILFQLLNVYPFLLNPVLALLLLPAIGYVTISAVKQKNISMLFLVLFFLFLFVSQAFLFVKWSRYMMPTLPFILLILSLFISSILHRIKKRIIHYLAFCILTGICIFFAFSYTMTAFLERDTRIVASEWAKNNIPHASPILSEVYDLGITPFNPTFGNITLFNFYDMDNPFSNTNSNDLDSALQNVDYIILPSQRILKTRLQNKQKFPNGYRFYNKLLHGKNNFKLIYQTQCNFFCRSTYIQNPMSSFEETAYVFDRPTILIFKKM